MEGISANVYKGLKTYWRRRGYKRLQESGPGRAEPGQESNPEPARSQKRRFWRVKIGRRVRVLKRFGSPKKWLTRLRDAYVKMMLNLSNSGLVGGGYGGPIEYGSGFGKGPVKEYDEKVIVEIYKSLVMAQGQLVPRDVAKVGSRPPIVSARSVIRI